jgi:hypothetical protein
MNYLPKFEPNKVLHLVAQRAFSFLRSGVSEDHYLQGLLSEVAFT